MNDKSQDTCNPASLDDLKLSDEQLNDVSGGAANEEDAPVTLPPCSRCGGKVEIYRQITFHMAYVVCKDCDFLEIVKIS